MKFKISFVDKRTHDFVEPLFSDLERRRRISIAEVSELTGFSKAMLRIYAIEGTIPGGRQAGKGKHWSFDRELLERWWQGFNAPRKQ